jgi:hypothetical protein
MPQVQIGPRHIADSTGTHEPGEVINNPTDALLRLAVSGDKDPESGQPWATVLAPSAPAAAKPMKTAAAPEVANNSASDGASSKERA